MRALATLGTAAVLSGMSLPATAQTPSLLGRSLISNPTNASTGIRVDITRSGAVFYHTGTLNPAALANAECGQFSGDAGATGFQGRLGRRSPSSLTLRSSAGCSMGWRGTLDVTQQGERLTIGFNGHIEAANAQGASLRLPMTVRTVYLVDGQGCRVLDHETNIANNRVELVNTACQLAAR